LDIDKKEIEKEKEGGGEEEGGEKQRQMMRGGREGKNQWRKERKKISKNICMCV
jgi:hypothetical protein